MAATPLPADHGEVTRATTVDLAAVLARPFAHRGLHDAATPENSLAAFEAAIAAGLAIELDVRLSADGIPVVFHDPRIRRMCGRPERLCELGVAELSRLQLAGTPHGIPTLAAALHAIGGRTPVLVDVKAGLVPSASRRRLVDAVSILLRSARGEVAVVGFDPMMLAAVGDRAPRVARGQSGGVDAAVTARWWSRTVCRPIDDLWSLRLSRAHFVTFNVDRLPSRAVERVRASLPVVTWTVRTVGQLSRAEAAADGVIVEDAAAAAIVERVRHQRWVDSPGSISAARRPA